MQVTNRKIISDKGIIEFPKIFLYPFLDLPKEFFEMKRLEMSKNEFKLVTMVLALRNDNKLYSGTIKDMCEFLGIGSDSRNKKNILNALSNLTSQGILRYDVERNFYTIRLDLKCTEKEIIQLDKEWLETIKIYKARETALIRTEYKFEAGRFVIYTIHLSVKPFGKLSKSIPNKSLICEVMSVKPIPAVNPITTGYGMYLI